MAPYTMPCAQWQGFMSCLLYTSELETYYRTTVDFAQVDEAAARCAELFGLEAPSPDC